MTNALNEKESTEREILIREFTIIVNSFLEEFDDLIQGVSDEVRKRQLFQTKERIYKHLQQDLAEIISDDFNQKINYLAQAVHKSLRRNKKKKDELKILVANFKSTIVALLEPDKFKKTNSSKLFLDILMKRPEEIFISEPENDLKQSILTKIAKLKNRNGGKFQKVKSLLTIHNSKKHKFFNFSLRIRKSLTMDEILYLEFLLKKLGINLVTPLTPLQEEVFKQGRKRVPKTI